MTFVQSETNSNTVRSLQHWWPSAIPQKPTGQILLGLTLDESWF